MEKAIKKAIEGGWNTHLKNFIEPMVTVGYINTYAGIPLSTIWLDPLFWQSLGRAEGWEQEKYNGTNSCTHWLAQQHRFIDHLALGKTPDEFFNSLLR